jgi:hypothetical protein
MKRLLSTVLEVLREIFDEAAYARFRAGSAASRSSYAAFVRQKYERPKARCC